MAINNGTQRVADGHYINESIDVCRGCLGTGTVPGFPDYACQTCDGTGKVLVSKDIQITVKPFKPTNK